MANPTAKQRRRWNQIAELGCIPCFIDSGISGTPATISHLHNYGYKNHDRVVAECPMHHLYQFAVNGTPNREKNLPEFRERYGTDDELADIVASMLDGVQ